MAQKAVKEICVSAKAGEFSKALQLINVTKLLKENALNVLISVSTACYHNPEKCDLNTIEKLLNTLVSYIDILEESHMVLYFQATFHITKLLCKKERFNDLTKMETVIIPVFLKDLTKKDMQQAQHAYLGVIKLISHSIGLLAQAKNTKYNKYLLEIYKILLNAHNKLSCPKDLITFARMCLNQFQYLEVSNDQLHTCYYVLLEVLSSNFGKISEYTDTIQVLLVPIFANILTIIIHSENFEFATFFIDSIETRVRLNFKLPEYANSHLLFKAVSALFPSNKEEIQDNIVKSQIFLKSFKTSHKKLFYNIINFLEEPVSQVIAFYKHSGIHVWCQLPDSAVSNTLKFLMEEITCHSMLSPKICSCGCSIAKNYSSSLKIGCQMAALLKSFVGQSKDKANNLSKEFFSQMGKWLYYFYEIIKKLKDGSCQKWSIFYSDLASSTYNISIVLYNAKNSAHRGVDLCFLKNSLRLEGTEPKIRPVGMNTFVFTTLCEIEFKNQNWMACMGLAAFHCLLYPQNSNTIFQNWWIRSKIKIKEDSDFQLQTLLSVLYKQSKQLGHIFNVESLLTTDKKIELLTFELSRYKAVWKSKASMMAAFEHLIKVADVEAIAEAILEIYSDGDVPLHNNMSSIFLSVSREIEKFLQKGSSTPKVRLALAVLHYYQFKTAFKETLNKNLQEMEKARQVMESAKKLETIEAVPKDANDECDIVSAYSNLRLTKVVEVLNSLNTCIDLISALIDDPFEPNILKSISKLLAKIGFEYRLHCFSINSQQAFEISMKCAQKVSDIEGQLFALSFLIEPANMKNTFVKKLISTGDELVKLLEEDNEHGQFSRSLTTYHICKSKAFLYEDPKQSYEAWQKADALTIVNKDKFKILRAELYIILYKLTKNCDFIQGEHEREPMTLKLHSAFDIVIDMVQNDVLTSYELCVLFDTVHELTKVYLAMRLPRDLRAYSKHYVVLAQKMFLPMRCMSFLLLLALSDLATSKFDHCTVKLSGIDDILSLSQSRTLMLPAEKPINVKNESGKLQKEVDQCTDLIQELVLDVPQHTKQYSSSSPRLTVEGFKFPPFLLHKKACICFVCLSLEIQRIVLEKYHLNALVNMYEKDDELAEEFFIGTMALYNKLNQHFNSYKAKASKLISDSLISEFEDTFLEPYASILYDYSFHMCRMTLKSKALKINTKLIQIIKPKKMKYTCLYHAALLQRLNYIVPDPQEKIFQNSSVLNNLSTALNDNRVLANTPVNKTTAVTVTINGIPDYSPPKRKGKQCNLFGATNDVDDSLKKTHNKAFKGKTPKAKKSKNSEEYGAFAVPKLKEEKACVATPSTPFFGSVETPTIHIFTDDGPSGSVKTYSQKRTRNLKKTELFDSNFTKLKSKSNNGTLDENVRTSQIPVNNKSVTHQVPVISTKKTRGQLLAQKIKESSAQNGIKATSTRLRKKVLVDEILKEKVKVPSSKEDVPTADLVQPGNEDDSIILVSPEHEIAVAKTKIVLEKLKSSVKKAQSKTARLATGSALKKNLLCELEGSETSTSSNSSQSTRSTGAIKRSTRSRV